MATYDNCYEILANVRYGINEYSSAYMAGTDTTCPHQNSYLVRMINRAQRHIYNMLLQREKGIFLESASLTGVNSVFTLPWDFGRLAYFKDENGAQVFPVPVQKLKATNATGSDRLYYRDGNTFVLDKAGVTETYTLLYYRKARDLDQGSSSTGGAQTVTLASTAKGIADYYNGMVVENVTDNTVDTISDYTAVRVATVSNTWAASKTYGIVSDLPEMFHFLIAPKAIHYTKAESPVIQEKPTQSELLLWVEMFRETFKAYVGTEDVDIEEIFCDYGMPARTFTGIVTNA